MKIKDLNDLKKDVKELKILEDLLFSKIKYIWQSLQRLSKTSLQFHYLDEQTKDL